MTSPLECGKMDAVDKALMVIQSVQKVGEN